MSTHVRSSMYSHLALSQDKEKTVIIHISKLTLNLVYSVFIL